MERCPICNSTFIQYNNMTAELYCLEKSCNHKWQEELIYDEIENVYLRTSIWESSIERMQAEEN